MKNLVVALSLSAIVAAPAYAADEGFYAGLTLGRSKVSAPAGATLSKSTGTVGGILGGYQFNKYWGMEAQFTGAGKFEAGGVSGKSDVLGLSAVGRFPVNERFSLYGKLGINRDKTTLTNAVGATGATRTSLGYGLGAQYSLTPTADLRFGWDRYGAAINDTVAGGKNKFNDNVLSVGALLKF